jgi:predicted glycosyltransferase
MKQMAKAMPLLRDVRSDRDEVCLSKTACGNGKMKIWIDLDNTPHVPFFKPIIRELEKAGYAVALTARDAFQVCDLAETMGLKPLKVGRHYGKNRFMKVGGLGFRSLQLFRFFMKERPVLGLSHGSRAQILLCNLLRIPTVMIMDYEHAQTPLLLRPRWEIVPKVLLSEDLQCKHRDRIRAYEGIKEDVYAPEFIPDAKLPEQLGIGGNEIVVTVRPPANEAHYHNPESEVFFEHFMQRACRTEGVKIVLLPRNNAQDVQMRAKWPAWFADSKVVVPKGAVDGLNLLWHSDLVVSGGGTMNREAAALGVPVYSVFRGRIGAVDCHLQKEGRLTLIERVEDIDKKILLQPRKKNVRPEAVRNSALADIVGHVQKILTAENHVSKN